ncbi:MAG: hypothetical protein CFE23_06485 [Flavobacterium sp. BFFFF1]|uniref:hypothetical protein n=1 Tax=unclassified Flavobacterium TaxID=196869 RepID=UPI000BC3A41A|nr:MULTISPECIES: hypothetical protein [unclassified Flavobacterium]OYU81132.1 MAG: hypothetical protein CFE23_06485 [Flavobacterium sp. BFFFF1]
MKSICFKNIIKLALCVFFAAAPKLALAQDQATGGDFWDHVRFGGGLGLSFGSDYTNIAVAPGAIYQFNNYFALGVGLQGSYIKVKGDYGGDDLNNYKSWVYGGSIVALFNPLEQVQLSAELEEVRVNSVFSYPGTPDIKDNFWNTALFLGAGYRIENVTVGLRYDVLYDRDKSIYADPFMPFVRVYF